MAGLKPKGQIPLKTGSSKKNQFLTGPPARQTRLTVGQAEVGLAFSRAGQAVAEYFMLFLIVAAISLLAVSAFYDKSWQVANVFFDKTARAIMGEAVITFTGDGDCVAGGGETVSDGATDFCRFNLADCPSGWNRHDNWMTTASQSCTSSGTCNNGFCTSGFHAWDNLPVTAKDDGTNAVCVAVATCGGHCIPCNAVQCYPRITQVGCTPMY